MIFRSFRIKVIFRIALLAILMVLLFFAINKGNWYAATIVTSVLIISVLIELFYFIDRSNRDLYNLLLSLKQKDFSQSVANRFSERSFKELEDLFSEIRKVYRDASIEREVHYQYLQFIINHINVTLICFREDGTISLFNPAARKMLGVTSPENISIIKKINKDLYDLILKLSSGQNELIRVILKGELMQLSVYATEFKLQEAPHKLVSIQDIKEELDAQELESWQKLIRVLTHEIMNSVTPISSLSSAIKEMLTGENGTMIPLSEIPADDIIDMYSSLRTIEERSRGLLKFVSNYKDLTRMPKPVFNNIRLDDLFENVGRLMKKTLEKNKIDFEIFTEKPDLSISADKDMIQQVLINLIVNARDALERKQNKKIRMTGFRLGEKTFIQVSDNGHGIDHESLDKVFIPFYTTKRKGSGIGLTLARQIMRLHKGSIYFTTEEAKGTVFTLEF